MAFSPDGKTLLTGCMDDTARLWDAATGEQIGMPLTHRGSVMAVAFSPDGKSVLTGSLDQTARLWDCATARPIGGAMQHQGPVMAVAFRPDGKAVLTASGDNTVRLWPIAQLPDDLDRVTTWVESITGLDLDDAGSIQVMDNARWLERRDKVIQQGGPPLWPQFAEPARSSRTGSQLTELPGRFPRTCRRRTSPIIEAPVRPTSHD